MIPRLTSAERDANLADNDPLTVPPIGVVNPAIEPGLLIFNTTENTFQYWDGVLWSDMYSDQTPGNDGVVKVQDSHSSMQLVVDPSSGFGEELELVFNTPLNFAPSPTTNWPDNELNPGASSSIYGGVPGNMKWKENAVHGQVHIWRMIASATMTTNDPAQIVVTMRNPSSGFDVSSSATIASGSQGNPGILTTFYFITIADDQSIGSDKGYKFYVKPSEHTIESFVIKSLTRISLAKD